MYLFLNCCCSLTKWCPTLRNPMDCNMPDSPVFHYLPVCSDSWPLSWWCYLTISPSTAPFSFCLQSFLASGSFPMSQLFASGGQIIRASASVSVLPMNIQYWSPSEWTGWISLHQGTLKSLLQHHSSKASILQRSGFFIVQLSHPKHDYWKNHSFD